jgi:hypothetical protein
MSEMGGELGRPGGELLHPGFRGAHEVVDQHDVRAQAQELVTSYSEVLPLSGDEYNRNARTALWEGLTASGHVSRIEITGTLEQIQADVINRLVMGLRRDLPEHEYNRRFEELCNMLVINEVERRIVAGELPPNTAVHELSDYPSVMLAAEADRQGYRSRNQKGFSRSTFLNDNGDGTYTRVTESLSRSNSSDGSTLRFLDGAGVRPAVVGSADLRALGTPILYSTEQYSDGIIDIQRMLDAHASAQAGETVRYGERLSVRPDTIAYEETRAESQRREEMVAFYEPDLARLEHRLDQLVDQGRISEDEKLGQLNSEILQVLRAICAFAPQFAKDCFGEEAAEHYVVASNLLAQGQEAEALLVLNQARAVEKPVIICGGMLNEQKAADLGVGTSDLASLIQKGRENWKTSKGACRVKNCPSPKPTDLGPCQVCLCSCQPIFDRGREPAYASPAQRLAEVVVDLFRSEKVGLPKAA